MTDLAEALTSRIDNLEARIAYQDETIEALNRTVVEQWARLDAALARIRQLEARIREVQVSAIRDPGDEAPPPHY